MVHTTRRAAAALVALLALSACGQELPGAAPGDPTPTPTASPPATSPPATTPPGGGEEPTDHMDTDEQTIIGAFGGEQQLEGGCAWVEAGDGTRYEVLWPEGYRVAFEPLQLVGPDGDVLAGEGDRLTVHGRTAEDRASICMVGPIFEAREVEPAA